MRTLDRRLIQPVDDRSAMIGAAMTSSWILHSQPQSDSGAPHASHGTRDPSVGTPARVGASVRRTSTIDTIRPHGLNGGLVLLGRARDLITRCDGVARVVAEASLEIGIDFFDDGKVTLIATIPPIPGIEGVIGQSVVGGFRRMTASLHRDDSDAQSLLRLMLDDVPVVTMVSMYSLLAAGMQMAEADRPRLRQSADVCAGWRSGGAMMTKIEASGVIPPSNGPRCPPLLNDQDPLAWHAFERLPGNGMRRHRRLDLIDGDPLTVDAFFRDSHMSAGGNETIVHEYVVNASLVPNTLEFINVTAIPKVLPWVECPDAALSARRLIGTKAEGLRPRVRKEFTGTATCTHLNDTLRSFDDIATLARSLAEVASAP